MRNLSKKTSSRLSKGSRGGGLYFTPVGPNRSVGIGIDIGGVGLKVGADNGGTVGIGLGIIGIEYNAEGGGRLDYFNGLYEIRVNKEGCTYIKDYYISGFYTHTEIQKIPGCDDIEPREDWDVGPPLPPEELTEDEENGNIPPGKFPEAPDVNDNCLVWAMVSYTYYIKYKEELGGHVFKSTVLLTEETPLEEIKWRENYQERLFDVGYQNITSTHTWEYKSLRRAWSLRGNHREEYGRGQYGQSIPIPGNGSTVIYGTLEHVRGYIQNKGYYDWDSDRMYEDWPPDLIPEERNRSFGRIHSIKWYTNCKFTPPKPYWPLVNYTKKRKMDEKCCFTEDDRTRLLLTAKASGAFLGYPVTTPATLQGFREDTVKIENTPQYLAYLHKYLDETLGQYPVTIQIPDTDPTKPGDQKSSPRDIGNVSELLGEIFGFVLQQAVANSDKRLEYGIAAEIELIKKNIFQVKYQAMAIIDYLDFAEDIEKKELKLAFNCTDANNFLDKSKQNVPVTVFKEDSLKNPSLGTSLNKLLIAAESIQQAFGVPIDSRNVPGSLLKFFKGIAGDSEKDKLDRVIDLLESGMLNNDNIGISDNPKVRKPNSEERNQS